ncbi:50S ribosomal protein L19e [Candidatus Woesearchaeota archaeon]|nr:50S ribosomal protein L19e [Candidatus Woesearchaeota archaeon]
MKLKTQKKLAAGVFKTSRKKVVFDPERLEDIKEAITKTDIRGLISDKAIKRIQKRGVSKVRVRKNKNQRKKGLRKGASTRKGKKTARISKKEAWMKKIRIQRIFLRELRDKKIITNKTFSDLYLKAKGNFFRSKRHIKIYLDEHKLTKK